MASIGSTKQTASLRPHMPLPTQLHATAQALILQAAPPARCQQAVTGFNAQSFPYKAPARKLGCCPHSLESLIAIKHAVGPCRAAWRPAHVPAMACSKYEYVKQYETDDRLLPGCWIVVRLDGKGFTKCAPPPPPPLPPLPAAVAACCLLHLSHLNNARVPMQVLRAARLREAQRPAGPSPDG
jgi:hypothetical protein